MKSKPTKRQIRIVEHFVKKTTKNVMNESLFSEQDDLMRGITYDDLITTLESNEPEINEQVVKRVFNELYKSNYNDALSDLKQNMKLIIKRAQG